MTIESFVPKFLVYKKRFEDKTRFYNARNLYIYVHVYKKVCPD